MGYHSIVIKLNGVGSKVFVSIKWRSCCFYVKWGCVPNSGRDQPVVIRLSGPVQPAASQHPRGWDVACIARVLPPIGTKRGLQQQWALPDLNGKNVKKDVR